RPCVLPPPSAHRLSPSFHPPRLGASDRRPSARGAPGPPARRARLPDDPRGARGQVPGQRGAGHSRGGGRSRGRAGGRARRAAAGRPAHGRALGVKRGSSQEISMTHRWLVVTLMLLVLGSSAPGGAGGDPRVGGGG